MEASGTDDAAARALADRLVAEVAAALDRADLADRELIGVLLGRRLVRAVDRALPPRADGQDPRAASRRLRHARCGDGGYPPGGQGYGYPPYAGRRYPPPTYGYRSVGPSCGQLLACNCCANLACNACCCGSQCAHG